MFILPVKSAELWEWNYLTPFTDFIELYSIWIYISPSYDQSGQFLIARAAEGHVFILDARPSKLFQVLGYVGNVCNNINYMVLSLFAARYGYFLGRLSHSPSFYLFFWRTRRILATCFPTVFCPVVLANFCSAPPAPPSPFLLLCNFS